jgi:hypothetical protein
LITYLFRRLLRMVFLQVPIIPNPVGVVGIHQRSEFQT